MNGSRVIPAPPAFVAGLVLIIVALSIGCAGSSSSAGASAPAAAGAAPESHAASPTAAGRVFGTAPILNGVPSIVLLEPAQPVQTPPPPEPPTMDQIQMTFTPELLLVRTGQPVEFRNSDGTMHNINVKEDATKAQAFNVALPDGGAYRYTFRRDGFYNVSCDVHPAMGASIVAASTPYVVATDTAGAFTLGPIPPGRYTAVALIGSRRLERPIQVGGDTQVTFQQE